MVLVRTLSACVLFLMLAKVNIWADTSTHLVLAVGYRALLLSAPLFLFLGVSNGLRLSLAAGLVSILTMFFGLNAFSIGLFALSMAVSGYICKYVNSHSLKGAADNKVSLNVGSLLSGFLIFLISNQNFLLVFSTLAMTATVYFAFKLNWDQTLAFEQQSQTASPRQAHRPLLNLTGWTLIGLATGIKLTGVFAILPQYLMLKDHILPNWYGGMIVVNSLGVIFFQHRILRLLNSQRAFWTPLCAATAMLLLAMPAAFHVENLFMALLWVSLLTFGECALSSYDKWAVDEGRLLPKELFVGVGSFLTVYLSREHTVWIHLSGLIGLFCLIAGVVFVALSKSKHCGSFVVPNLRAAFKF